MVSLGQRYSELVAAGELREEQGQKMAVSCLDQLQKELTLSSSKNVFSFSTKINQNNFIAIMYFF